MRENHKIGHIRYGIKVNQRYAAADGRNGPKVLVLDVHTHEDCDDVVVRYENEKREWRIDCFKLAMVRYYKIFEIVEAHASWYR